VFTATMVEDAVLTMLLSTMAARVGPARVMAATAPLIALGGLLLALPESRGLVLLGAVLGTLSPNGQEAGPFAPMGQALLPRTVLSGSTVVSGLTMAAAATPLPFLLAGGLKIVYDLSLFFRFRPVPLDDPTVDGTGRR
jgi:hypothetical protein